jgi:hypothetical protein
MPVCNADELDTTAQYDKKPMLQSFPIEQHLSYRRLSNRTRALKRLKASSVQSGKQ